jgi:hypothetical protein
LRNFPAAWVADALSPDIIICHLIEVFFDSGTVRLSDLNTSINYLGNVWDGSGGLGSIESVRSNASAEVVPIRFTLSGVPSAAVSLALQEQYSNRIIRLYQARFNKTTILIESAEELFSGLIGTLNLETDETGQNRSLVVTAEGENVTLSRASGRRSNHEDHLSMFPNDRFFHKVSALENQEVVWPSKEAQAQYA